MVRFRIRVRVSVRKSDAKKHKRILADAGSRAVPSSGPRDFASWEPHQTRIIDARVLPLYLFGMIYSIDGKVVRSDVALGLHKRSCMAWPSHAERLVRLDRSRCTEMTIYCFFWRNIGFPCAESNLMHSFLERTRGSDFAEAALVIIAPAEPGPTYEHHG